MTLNDILSQIRVFSLDLNEKKYPQALILQFVNEGMQEMASKTKCLQYTTTSTAVVGTAEYDLPENFYDIDYRGGVRFDGKRLEQVTLQWLDNNDSGWYSASNSTPTKYYLRRDKIGLVPSPSSAGSLKLYYYRKPTALTSLTDIPFEGNRRLDTVHNGILYYALAKMYLIEGDANKVGAYMQMYNQKIEEMMQLVNDKDDLTQGIQPYIDQSQSRI